MKVAVAGVGAMGTRFALKLKQAGNDVTVVDGWDERDWSWENLGEIPAKESGISW